MGRGRRSYIRFPLRKTFSPCCAASQQDREGEGGKSFWEILKAFLPLPWLADRGYLSPLCSFATKVYEGCLNPAVFVFLKLFSQRRLIFRENVGRFSIWHELQRILYQPPLATKMRSEKEASKTKFTPCFCCCYDLIFHELFKGGEKKLAFKRIKDFLRGRREEKRWIEIFLLLLSPFSFSDIGFFRKYSRGESDLPSLLPPPSYFNNFWWLGKGGKKEQRKKKQKCSLFPQPFFSPPF